MFRISLVILALVCIVPSARVDAADSATPWVQPTVELTIHYPGGNADLYTGIPWRLGLTVLDAMKLADMPGFSASWSRNLAGWMVSAIRDVANQGPTGPNWLLCVNGYVAGVGAGAYVLGPGAKADWYYSSVWPPAGCQR